MTALDRRRPDVDWLRVGAVYLLIPYHAAKVFDDAPFYHLKNPEQSAALSVVTGAVHQAHMPLLFALAGWSLGSSLERRGGAAALRERGNRLLVPLAFGCTALAPAIGYVQLRHGEGTNEGFVEFLPTFFTQFERFTWSHLWFLAYLMTFTALYLPLLERLSRARAPEHVPARALYAALVPFAVVQITLRGRWPGYQNLYDDWANFAYFSLFLVGGFLLMKIPALEDAIQRERRGLAALALGGLAGMAVILVASGPPEAAPRGDWIAFQACSAAAGFGGVAWLIGFGRRRLSAGGPALDYLRDSAMPVYVLHQLAVVLTATAVVRLQAPIPAKLALLTAGSGALTLGAYHLLVRRRPLLRFLLGTKGAPPPRARRACLNRFSRSRFT